MDEANPSVFSMVFRAVFILGFIIAEFCFGPAYVVLGIFCIFAFSVTGMMLFALHEFNHGEHFQIPLLEEVCFCSYLGLFVSIFIAVLASLLT